MDACKISATNRFEIDLKPSFLARFACSWTFPMQKIRHVVEIVFSNLIQPLSCVNDEIFTNNRKKCNRYEYWISIILLNNAVILIAAIVLFILNCLSSILEHIRSEWIVSAETFCCTVSVWSTESLPILQRSLLHITFGLKSWIHSPRPGSFILARNGA